MYDPFAIGEQLTENDFEIAALESGAYQGSPSSYADPLGEAFRRRRRRMRKPMIRSRPSRRRPQMRRRSVRRLPRRMKTKPSRVGRRIICPRRRPCRPVQVRPRPITVISPRVRRVYLPPKIILQSRPAVILSRFSDGRAALRGHHHRQIRQIANYIVSSWRSRRPIKTIRIVGHADNRGNVDCTQRIGLKRARVVRQQLTSELNSHWPGLIRRIAISTHTAGARRPIVSNMTVPGRAINRRVAIFLYRT